MWYSGKTARRGPVAEDLTGQRFGKLVAVRRIRSQNGRTRWECRCDCGNEVEVTEDGLLHGNYKSCGCLRQEIWKELPGQLHMVDGTCVEMLEKRKHRSDNTSGFRGIYHMNNGKYRATIGFKGKRFYIGTFKIMKMQYRHAWKQKIPFTEVLSRPGIPGTALRKKIRSGPKNIHWYTKLRG